MVNRPELKWLKCILFFAFPGILLPVMAHSQTAQPNLVQPQLLGHPVERGLRVGTIDDRPRADFLPRDSKDGSSVQSSRKGEASGLEDGESDATTGTWFQAGHTGAWYNLAQDGHGLFVEVLEDVDVPTGMQVFAAWYVFVDGKQVWIVAVGPVVQDGNRHRAQMDAFIYAGGDFPPNYNPDAVTSELWGTVSLEFHGCSAATLGWETDHPGFASGTLDLVRLTWILGATCDPQLGGDPVTGDDHGNTWQTGTLLTENAGITGQIETEGDVDVFTFSVDGGDANVKVYTTGSMDSVGELFELAGSNEISLQTDDDGGEGLNFLIDRNVGPGDYSVHVSAFSGTGAYLINLEISEVQNFVEVTFENFLRRNIRAYKNGTLLGVVPPGEIRGDTYAVDEGDQFWWEISQEFGDEMAGFYSPIEDLTVTKLDYVVDNVIGSSEFFIPSISNKLGANKLLGVNMELEIENRCDCVIPANSDNVLVGYFRLLPESNCRMYDEGSDYSGDFIWWDEFYGDVEALSGYIEFTIDNGGEFQ